MTTVGLSEEESQSSLRVEAGWPAEPPTFPPVALPDELMIPLPKSNEIPAGAIEAGGFVLRKPIEGKADLLAPTAGVIESVEPALLMNGDRIRAARLKTSIGSPAEKRRPQGPIDSKHFGDWIDVFRRHGVWADRYSSPDLIGQCYAALARPVDTIILNLMDVDPTLPMNAALMAREPEEMQTGVELIARLSGATTILAATDLTMPPSWSAAFCPKPPLDLACRIVPLVNAYPQSDPSLLIYAILNRRLPPGRLPVEVGTIVLDAAAAIALGRVQLHGESMLTVPIALRDHSKRQSHFRTVPIGLTVDALLRTLRMPASRFLKLRGGDVLRDCTIAGDAVAGGSELVIHAGAPEPPNNPDPCVRCGWCIESCPTLVQPAQCLDASQRDDLAMARRFGIDGCIECGICSYVCPSRLPILEGIRELRKKS